MSEILQRLGKELKKARKSAGLKQAEAGKKIGLGYQRISAFENGDPSLTVDQADRLARAIGTSLQKLLSGTTITPTEEQLLEMIKDRDRRIHEIQANLAEPLIGRLFSAWQKLEDHVRPDVVVFIEGLVSGEQSLDFLDSARQSKKT